MEVLGIDVGGTGIKAGIVDTDKGKLISEKLRLLTPLPATPLAVSEQIARIAIHYKWKGQIGCGFPSVVRGDIVRTAVNIHSSWVNVNLAELVYKSTGCKTKVLNDADAAGIAEMEFGAGMNNKGVVLIITVGTGVGTALFTSGKLVPNSEFGQLRINETIAENYISAKVKETQDLSWKKWSQRFTEFIACVENHFYPDLIIVGGGISKKPEKFLDRIFTGTEVKIAHFGNNAGIIGAALFAAK